MHSSSRVLFILKKRDVPFYDLENEHYSMSSGLKNSAKFNRDMLIECGIRSKLVEVNDNNDIDKEVNRFKPTHVIIEALWVIPEKFEVLSKLYPTVKWIVRMHSEIPFLSQEGVAMEWIFNYIKYRNVKVAFNSKRTADTFKELVHKSQENKISYLPNYYPIVGQSTDYKLDKTRILNVGCFGAIRQLKNQLIQATAAIIFAKRHDYKLRFHINADREDKGIEDSTVKNIRNLFKSTLDTELIEHQWHSHQRFIQVIRSMDIGLQVSFTESFNIVSADFIDNHVPIVTSPEISWTSSIFQADVTNVNDIVDKMERALSAKKHFRHIEHLDFNFRKLRIYSEASKFVWCEYFTPNVNKLNS